MDDFGSALTGQTMEPTEAADRWDEWLTRPGNRTAMLQMGLQMMQPVGIGQTVGGHVAQAIGAGGEAVTRADAADLKERTAEAKMQAADERLRILQQNADTSERRASAAVARSTNKKVGGLTDLFRARAARQDARDFERQLDRDAAAIEKRASGTDAIMNPDDPVVKQYKGKTREEIRESLRASRPKPKYGAVPGVDDDDDDGTDDPATAMPKVQAPEGFQQYSDGAYYKPDPKNPGKFLRWRP